MKKQAASKTTIKVSSGDGLALALALPRVPMELGCDHRIVIERPQCPVAEAVVEAVDFLFAERDGLLIDAVVDERWGIEVRNARPPHPRSLGVLEHGAKRTHETARADAPFGAIP